MRDDLRTCWRSLLLTAAVGGVVLALACMQPAPRVLRPRLIAVPLSRRPVRRRLGVAAIMLFDHRFIATPGAQPPSARVYRPRDHQWLNPATLKWQADVPPLRGFDYKPIRTAVAGQAQPAYAGLYELTVETPDDAWGINEDLVIFVHENTATARVDTYDDAFYFVVNPYPKADVSGWFWVTDATGKRQPYYIAPKTGAEIGKAGPMGAL